MLFVVLSLKVLKIFYEKLFSNIATNTLTKTTPLRVDKLIPHSEGDGNHSWDFEMILKQCQIFRFEYLPLLLELSTCTPRCTKATAIGAKPRLQAYVKAQAP